MGDLRPTALFGKRAGAAVSKPVMEFYVLRRFPTFPKKFHGPIGDTSTYESVYILVALISPRLLYCKGP